MFLKNENLKTGIFEISKLLIFWPSNPQLDLNHTGLMSSKASKNQKKRFAVTAQSDRIVKRVQSKKLHSKIHDWSIMV
jgi:hypothetical protein